MRKLLLLGFSMTLLSCQDISNIGSSDSLAKLNISILESSPPATSYDLELSLEANHLTEPYSLNLDQLASEPEESIYAH